MSKAKAIHKHRRAAYLQQSGRCYYCQSPMWLDHRKLFARARGITHAQSRVLRCTAEHVVARCDGGTNSGANIVAACLCCNQRRHACQQPMDSPTYLAFVRQHLSRGEWHSLKLPT